MRVNLNKASCAYRQPHYLVLDCQDQWQDLINKAEDIVAIDAWSDHLQCSDMPFAFHSALLQCLLRLWIMKIFSVWLAEVVFDMKNKYDPQVVLGSKIQSVLTKYG